MQQKKIPATITVLTYQSERGLERCLQSVADFAEILVLDGGSTDRTLEIARNCGARIETQSDQPGPIRDFTAVRERSFSLASQDWIFWLDSDEWMDAELAESIQKFLLTATNQIACRAERFPIINGNIIRQAYFIPDRVLRLVNRQTAHWVKGKKVHEHLAVDEGVIIEDLAGGVYTPWLSLEEYRKKDRYYLHLAFQKTLTRRPALGVTVRSIVKNLFRSVAILGYGLLVGLRYGYATSVLPFAYHARFARYHSAIAWERLRQYYYGISYVPPQA